MISDQDPAMPVALGRVFPNTIHRLCLWHVQNRYMPYLNELYARFEEEDFKTRFQSIIHHPLTVTEFETAWAMLIDDFHLHDNISLSRMYEIRKDWIPAFFKHDYFGLMVSTQRSESMNKLVKSAHVDANTPLHQFAKQMLKLLHSRKMKEAKEALGCMGQKETNTLYMFEIRVARTYTRAVMNKFHESLKYATAYKISHDPDGGVNEWVVQHTSRSNRIVWGQHQFKVMADVDAGKYECECKHWEHTGLLCVHLLRTFMHLQIDRIPSEYILQRYTYSAIQDVTFSRDDKNLKGKDGETKSYRQKMLLKKSMKVVHHASLSKAGYDRALEMMDELLLLLSRLEPDIEGDDSTSDGEGIQGDRNDVRDMMGDNLTTRMAQAGVIQLVPTLQEGGVSDTQCVMPQQILEQVIHDYKRGKSCCNTK
ncbi:protein FAR1-RELATED SEQUENCE 5-like [Zea mays]|uniref:protein FAR1-RELATED SEQUENCE 5-like n=1 Tax=Zea mays TaxID=4577 RepID=UPI0009AA3162|nr:protein FAR1-RELATED SEQUENCE 5-like [Zea mays]|eukprot:XP_020404390.1 protein FAR1-RELATED SEQUENCE 5-like [Zea mays]